MFSSLAGWALLGLAAACVLAWCAAGSRPRRVVFGCPWCGGGLTTRLGFGAGVVTETRWCRACGWGSDDGAGGR